MGPIILFNTPPVNKCAIRYHNITLITHIGVHIGEHTCLKHTHKVMGKSEINVSTICEHNENITSWEYRHAPIRVFKQSINV